MTGYQVGKPVIAGIMETVDNGTGLIQRTSVNVWKPGKTHHESTLADGCM